MIDYLESIFDGGDISIYILDTDKNDFFFRQTINTEIV